MSKTRLRRFNRRPIILAKGNASEAAARPPLTGEPAPARLEPVKLTPANPPRPRPLGAVLGRAALSALVIYLLAIVLFALFHGGLHWGYVEFLARENLPMGLMILVLLAVRNFLFRRR